MIILEILSPFSENTSIESETPRYFQIDNLGARASLDPIKLMLLRLFMSIIYRIVVPSHFRRAFFRLGGLVGLL